MDSGRDAVALSAVASAAAVRALALEAGFDLCGFARPEPIPGPVLLEWLAAGMAADMDWVAGRAADRLDPLRLLPGARTVVALASNYWTDAPAAEASPIARYARGRDYHATMRDRLRTFRRLLRTTRRRRRRIRRLQLRSKWCATAASPLLRRRRLRTRVVRPSRSTRTASSA